MTKRAQSFGHRRERKIKALLEDQGWFVVRAPGSLGYADLGALQADQAPWLIEVKATAAGPFHSFGPADRNALLEAAAKAGAEAMLAYWPANGELRWIRPAEWPS